MKHKSSIGYNDYIYVIYYNPLIINNLYMKILEIYKEKLRYIYKKSK